MRLKFRDYWDICAHGLTLYLLSWIYVLAAVTDSWTAVLVRAVGLHLYLAAIALATYLLWLVFKLAMAGKLPSVREVLAVARQPMSEIVETAEVAEAFEPTAPIPVLPLGGYATLMERLVRLQEQCGSVGERGLLKAVEGMARTLSDMQYRSEFLNISERYLEEVIPCVEQFLTQRSNLGNHPVHRNALDAERRKVMEAVGMFDGGHWR